MRKALLALGLLLWLTACDREIEEPVSSFGQAYQPLDLGRFWLYEVDQTIYFGENDFETEQFFLRDRVRSFFINEEREQVYIIDRERSEDQSQWERVSSFTRFYREETLIENQENQAIVALVFPPVLGTSWDANVYRAEPRDEFEVVSSLSFEQGNQSETGLLRILQNEEDDQVTFRDNRYEIYGENIGMVEKYSEVVTYCSRNDCLGEQLINSGEVLLMKLVDYGRE